MANWWDKYSEPVASGPAASGNWWDKYAVADDAPDFGDVNSGVSSSAPDPNASFLDSAWRANKAQMGPIFAGNVKRMAAEVSDPIAGLLNGTFGKPAAEDAPELSLAVNPNGNASIPTSPLIAPDAGMALMDEARSEPLRNATLRDLQQSGLAQARAGGAELQQARADMEVPESGLERYAKLAAISAGPTLAGMTAGIVTKSPAVGAGVSTLFAVPSAYGEARDAGHSVEDAIKYAGVVGGAEVVSERLGFDALLGKLATRLPAGKLATVLGALEKSVPGRALTGAGVEGTTEALSQAAQNAYKIAALDEDMTFDEFMSDVRDSFGAGAVIGGPLAGGHAALEKVTNGQDKTDRIRALADQVSGFRSVTPESEAVDSGRDAARAIFAATGTDSIDTGTSDVGVAPEPMADLDEQLADILPQPAQEQAEQAPIGAPEPIRNNTRVLYRGDPETINAAMDSAGLPAGFSMYEDGKPVGVYFPASMQSAVDEALASVPKKAEPEPVIPDGNQDRVEALPDVTEAEASQIEAPAESRTEGSILEVPIDSLTLSDDVPQFKSGARSDGVVEPLGGTFDRRGTGPIQIWRRKDGRMEVVSGRHRLDLARRSGEKTIPAQVYNESDGFDAQQAASLDAELNIRDGQGKVKDYVQYFAQPAFDGPSGKQAADARGLLARATGKRAYTIASQGDAELIAAHSADQITDEAAVQIAQAAPNNAPLQALGMKLVQEGKSITVAANAMRAVRSMQGDRPQNTADMFGFDDSAIQDAVKMANVAARKQREIAERLAAITGAAKRPEIARREGVDVRDPESLPKRIAELRAEKTTWDDWSTDPAKVAAIREELGMAPQPDFAEPDPESEQMRDDMTAQMFSRRRNGVPDDAEVRELVEQYVDVDGAPSESEIREAVKQYRETESAYGGREAYDKAKAEGHTNLNFGQWVQVRTPNFKRWFGDWQADPENASKVVDPKTGEPMVVYHGTASDFDSFKPGENRAIYFTAYPWDAEEYARNIWADRPAALGGPGPSIMPVYLSIQDPLVYDFGGREWTQESGRRAVRAARQNGKDGVIFHNVIDTVDGSGIPGRTFVAFHPNQIKSATANIGTFGKSGNILFSRRPGGASSDLFGGPSIDDTNRAPANARRAESADLFGGPTMAEQVAAAGRDKDAARNRGTRNDDGDGGLFDGPRPEQTVLRSQRKPDASGVEVSELSDAEAEQYLAEILSRQQAALDENADPLVEAFKIIAKGSGVFRNKLLAGRTMSELAPKAGVTYTGRSEDNGTPIHMFRVEQSNADPATAKIYDDGNDVWVDVSDLKSGGGAGERIYNMAFSFARNNGRNFIEDPSGLSDSAMYRRPVQQTAAMLKAGTAENIAPGDFLATQRPGGPKTRPIKAPANRDFDATLRENLLTVYSNAVTAVPEIAHVKFDAEQRQFIDRRTGEPVGDKAFDGLARNRRLEPVREAMVRVGNSAGGSSLAAAPVGGNTLKVAALIGTMRSAQPHERPAILAALRDVVRGGDVALARAGLKEILPSKKEKTLADAGVSVSGPALSLAQIQDAVRKEFGTAKILTRLTNSGAVSLITKAQAIQRGLGSAKSLEGVKGLHDGTRGYLITDELQPNEVAGVLIHEIGVHHSMERILGAERFAKLQKAMESFRARGDNDVLAAYAAVPRDTPAHHVNHEAIAYLAEHSVNHSITQKIVDATKLFLNRLGVPMSWIKAEPAAVRRIARESLLAESRRGNGSVRYNGRDTLYQKVWHGTPHRDIEKTGFSLQKIGTGEGAQAYGWGMYFAKLRDIAEHYRKTLAEDNMSAPTLGFEFAGKQYDKMTAEGHALNLIKNGGKRAAMSTAKDMLADAKAGKPYTTERGKGVEHYQRLYDFVLAFEAAKASQIKVVRDKGQLYHAEIPEDSDLLDWDKPLSEQPEKVRVALAAADFNGDEVVSAWKRNGAWEHVRGEMLYKHLAGGMTRGAEAEGKHAAASKYLQSIGIPGLRYLDGNSRRHPDQQPYQEGLPKGWSYATDSSGGVGIKDKRGLWATTGHANEANAHRHLFGQKPTSNYVIWDQALLTPEKAQITPYYSKRADDEDQTQTPEFKRWFGDSKVVDADGKPLVVYHGTDREFTEFRMGSAPGWGRGIYFTDNRDQAEADYGGGAGGRVVEAYLSIRNPWRGGFPGYEEVEGTRAWQGYTGRFEDSLDAWDEDGRFAGEVLRELGYDGVIAENSNDIRGLEIVAFDPRQIKSAIGNRGTFDPGNPNILKSRRTPSDARADAAQRRNEANATLGDPRSGGSLGWNFDANKWEGTKGTIRRARAALDDKMIAWRDVQDSIADHLGKTIPDAQNVYRLENLMHGRVKEGIDDLEHKMVEPLVRAMKERGITTEALEEYLYALHAKERNDYIASINPKMPDGGSGMTNAEADVILAKPLPLGMKEIAKRAKAIIRQTRQRMLDHGIITQEQFDAMESQYKNYVPLRGKRVGENEFDSGGGNAGRGIDGRPSPVKQAFGRGAGNRAENILGEIIGDAQRSIIAAEKARVGRAVMRIVLANPNPKLWTVEPVLTERKLDSTGEVYEAVVQDWSDPSIVAVRHRGQIYKVQINHAPLAKALNLVGVDQIGAVTRAAGALNRYFSAVLTRYNPAFIPVNAARDALFGLTGLAVEHGEVTAMKAALYYPKAIKAAWREARRLPPKSAADTYAREFAEDGGKTGFVSMPSVEELQRKISKGRFGGYSPSGIAAAAKAVGDVVGVMNDAVENALRLSAYVQLRKQGMSREKAASYAKELTVNFNRKGEEGTRLNSWFLFYNASLQGAKRTAGLAKSPKAWGYVGALAATQVIAAMFAMGQEDDEGTPIWDKIPDHVKQRNIVFTWLDDEGEQKLLTIPMPYGFNVVTHMAGRVTGAVMHKEDRPQDRAMSLASDAVSSAVQSFSPVPLDDGAMGLVPTIVRIPLSLQVNRDDFGRQIRKENPFGKFDVPRASIGKPDTLEMFKVMATGLNRIGGGDERTPPPMSAFDVAPEDIEYVLEKLGGGTGKFIIDMATVGQKATGELPVEARDIPIAKRFFTNVNEPAAQQAMFYERREAIERDADMVRDVYEKDGPEAAIALLRSTPSLSGADFRRYKESDPKKGHRKGGIVLVEKRPQLVVRNPDSVYGRYKAAAGETSEINEAMRNAYADSPMSLRPSGERDKRLKELADKRMAAQRIFNAAWNRDVVGGE